MGIYKVTSTNAERSKRVEKISGWDFSTPLHFGRNDYTITNLGYNRHRRSHETHLLARYAVAFAPYDRSVARGDISTSWKIASVIEKPLLIIKSKRCKMGRRQVYILSATDLQAADLSKLRKRAGHWKSLFLRVSNLCLLSRLLRRIFCLGQARFFCRKAYNWRKRF